MHRKDNTLKKSLLHIGHLPKFANVSKDSTKLSKAADPSEAILSSPERLFVCEAAHASTVLKHTVVYSNYISNITNKLLILAFTTLNPNRNLHYPPNVHQIYFGNRSFCNFRCSSMRRHSGQKSKIYIMV